MLLPFRYFTLSGIICFPLATHLSFPHTFVSPFFPGAHTYALPVTPICSLYGLSGRSWSFDHLEPVIFYPQPMI